MREFIICSAIHYDDGKQHTHQPKNITSGIVICGRRHHNCIYTASALLGSAFKASLILRTCQGFLTSTDRYVNRQEAFKIAKAAGQLLYPDVHKDGDNDVLISEELFSEDIISSES